MDGKSDNKKLYDQQERYLDGLKRFRKKGIPIYIDGKESEDEELERILEICEDGAFYMGDYVGADKGCLKEIRFDKVYNK